MSEYVALCLLLPRVVVTWIVTGFPVSEKPTICAHYSLSLLPTRQVLRVARDPGHDDILHHHRRTPLARQKEEYVAGLS